MDDENIGRMMIELGRRKKQELWLQTTRIPFVKILTDVELVFETLD
jgi:hypothetical protein